MEEKPINRLMTANTNNDITNKYDERITSILLSVGIPASVKGYQYLRAAVGLCITNPDVSGRVTKVIYPTVATMFGTAPSKVERAMRHAIDIAWSRGRLEVINNLFGVNIFLKNDRPTNSEFIALIADGVVRFPHRSIRYHQ